MLNLYCYFKGSGIIIIHIGIIIRFYSWTQFWLSLIPILLTVILFEAFAFDGLVSCVLLSITTFYMHLRINSINKNIFESMKPKLTKLSSLIYHPLQKYIEDHNYLCSEVKVLSNYWKNLYLIFILTMFPGTLMLMHQVLFEDIELLLKMFFVSSTVAFYSILIVEQYFMASFSAKMHKTCKKLSHFQWFLRGKHNLRFKLKLMTYFERLSSNRKIGLSIGSLAIITFPLFAGVSDSCLFQ